MGKVSACNVGDPGSIPESGRSPGEGNGNLLQYSCLENPMDRGAWKAAVHGVAKSQTRLSNFTLLIHIPLYIYYIVFIHISVTGHLGCFHMQSIVNSTAMNIGVHVSFRIMFISEYVPRNGIAGSYDSSPGRGCIPYKIVSKKSSLGKWAHIYTIELDRQLIA